MNRWRWSRASRRRAPTGASEDLLRSLALIVEPGTLRASIADRVRELTGCDDVVVCCAGPESDAYAADFSTFPDSPHLEIAFAVHGTLSRWLRANQEAFLVPHPGGAFDYLDESEQHTLRRFDVRACLPLFSGLRLVAVLLLCSRRRDWQLAEEERDFLSRIARQAGLALENAELHQLERERLKNLHHAEQLAVAGQLAATVAHEIRNPLAAIRSTVQFTLQSTTDWETRRQLLANTLEEVDRIERTVAGVLALSRPAGIEFADLDLLATVGQSLLVVHAYAQAQGVTIERQIDSDTLPIRGDAHGLHQVLVNLFMNACQAMPDGGHLTVRCGIWQPSSEARALALLQVRDTGHGIRREDMAQVCNPFFTTKKTGTGLGLPICLDIVTRHGGNLRLESTPGRGTSVTVLLPLRN